MRVTVDGERATWLRRFAVLVLVAPASCGVAPDPEPCSDLSCVEPVPEVDGGQQPQPVDLEHGIYIPALLAASNQLKADLGKAPAASAPTAASADTPDVITIATINSVWAELSSTRRA